MSNVLTELVKALSGNARKGSELMQQPTVFGPAPGGKELISPEDIAALQQWSNPYRGTPQHRPGNPLGVFGDTKHRLAHDTEAGLGFLNQALPLQLPQHPGASPQAVPRHAAQPIQSAGFEFLQGPLAAARDTISNIWNSPFVQGVEMSPEERAERAASAKPDSMHENITEGLNRAAALPGDISDALNLDYLAGPAKEFFGQEQTGPPVVKVPYTLNFGEGDGAVAAQSLGPKAPAAAASAGPSGPVSDSGISGPDYAPMEFDVPENLSWKEKNWPKIQTALQGLARGAAMPLPVGGGSTGLLLARAATGMSGAFEDETALELEAERYADALGLKHAGLDIDRYQAESGRMSAEARQRSARAQEIGALLRGRVKDPRKEQARVWSPPPGGTRKDAIIAKAQTDAVSGKLPDNYDKMLHGFTELSLARTWGEDWKDHFEFSPEQRQTAVEDAMAREISVILSTRPELLGALYPGAGPELLELQAALAGLGGAGVEPNK